MSIVALLAAFLREMVPSVETPGQSSDRLPGVSGPDTSSPDPADTRWESSILRSSSLSRKVSIPAASNVAVLLSQQRGCIAQDISNMAIFWNIYHRRPMMHKDRERGMEEHVQLHF